MCAFCDRDQCLLQRVFLDRPDWFAFLAAPFHANGHTILAAKKTGEQCPTSLEGCSAGLGVAIAEVMAILNEHYETENVLIGSVRGDLPHFHFHLIPLDKNVEREWRAERLYERGHLLEFMGHLEEQGDARATRDRILRGESGEAQRERMTPLLIPHVTCLREIAARRGC
jgi:diadenosine tetraphosphate (Ap4A) HIT family hydrolase